MLEHFGVAVARGPVTDRPGSTASSAAAASRDERVLAAMARVPRELFVPEELRELAYEDAALRSPHGQTVSQPFMVALICQGLGLEGDERVLDVGTGSGYAAAVLAELAAEVHSIERIPELAEAARARSPRRATAASQVHVGDGWLGLPEHAPYGGIAVAAAAPTRARGALGAARRGRADRAAARLAAAAGAPRGRADTGGAEADPRGARPLRPARAGRRRG